MVPAGGIRALRALALVYYSLKVKLTMYIHNYFILDMVRIRLRQN